MKRMVSRSLALMLVLFLAVGLFPAAVLAADTTDADVQAVIDQLEAIDTLQQMQSKRYTYASNSRSDALSKDSDAAVQQEALRVEYEDYVARMFAARLAAQQAYDALTDDQKAQIDPSLVAKLSTELPTVLNPFTATLTPQNTAYSFMVPKGGPGQGYEVSNYMLSDMVTMVNGNIPQTFMMVNTADGATQWTPNGKYVYGESNYDVTYCCDVGTPVDNTIHYKRVNLEDSGYYGESAAQHIRAILMNSYPFITMDEMKAKLKAGGLSADFVDQLNRSDLIAGVQAAIWSYANASDMNGESLGYFASMDILKNNGVRYFSAYHDYTNEMWEWFPGKGGRSWDSQVEYRVNTLAYYLCTLDGIPAQDDEIVISDVKVTRADLMPGSSDTYQVGMYVFLNHSGQEKDDLRVTITSCHTNADGSTTVTAQNAQRVSGREKLEMSVKANSGDTIQVTVSGTQTLGKGVYFYEPEGGREASQCMVGVAEGKTNVHAQTQFTFEENIGDMGLRIYKTEAGSGSPLSDITFHIYKATPGEGEALSPTPTEEEIAKYATDANKVASLTTDATGYAGTALEEGYYLVVEEHNTAKIKAPVSPFYVSIPMQETVESDDGTTTTQIVNIVSVYPKNEPVTPPEVPPIVPPTPDNVNGIFDILKYDEIDSSMLLEGAKFEVYRPATETDADTKIITCEGVQYAVTPVLVNGEKLVLTTDENGYAVSPALSCGTYFLVEVEAPAGYNLLEEAVAVTVISSEMTDKVTVEIANQRGNILPETGGMGTTLFLAVGAVLVIGAVILLVTRKRMRNYEE